MTTTEAETEADWLLALFDALPPPAPAALTAPPRLLLPNNQRAAVAAGRDESQISPT